MKVKYREQIKNRELKEFIEPKEKEKEEDAHNKKQKRE